MATRQFMKLPFYKLSFEKLLLFFFSIRFLPYLVLANFLARISWFKIVEKIYMHKV